MNIIKFYTAELKSENEDNLKLKEENITDDVKKQIEEFLNYCNGKIANNEPYDILETKLPKQWKKNVIKKYNGKNYDDLAELLFDEFTDGAIASSGKGCNKYISILFVGDDIYIIHTSKLDGLGKSKRSKNISIIFNILTRPSLIRFIKLQLVNSKVFVYAWEREKTQHFRKFLGFEIDGYDDLGNITFYLRNIKNRFFIVKFEVFTDDLINHVINGDISLNYNKKKLIIGNDEYEIVKITSKNELKQKTYKDIKEFYTKLFIDYYNITSKLYEIVKKYVLSLDSMDYYIYEKEDSYDDKEFTVINGKKYLKEGNLTILAGFELKNNKLRFKEDYLNYLNDILLSALHNEKRIPICHILEEFLLDGINLGCLKVYNKININWDIDEFDKLYSTLLKNLIKYKNSKHVKDVIYLTLLNYYKLFFEDSYFSYLFDSLIKNYISNMDYGYVGYADYEDELIEYKEQKWWESKLNKQKTKISELINKLKNRDTPLFITIVGFSEDSRRILPIKGQKLSDNAVTELKDYANQTLKEKKIFYDLDIILPINYMRGYLLLIVFKRNEIHKLV